ncbi:hypothetical protein [Vibrio vulnificus YJ016]|uniref:Uncharacterized protein n=1 Tax=Vibrio vulnificus (strain YJ016) TaxID=196600 RepID=Q7MD67_VIBVY|nr:hypothetical protein [Vibrio vulnificus YJ016]
MRKELIVCDRCSEVELNIIWQANFRKVISRHYTCVMLEE